MMIDVDSRQSSPRRDPPKESKWQAIPRLGGLV